MGLTAQKTGRKFTFADYRSWTDEDMNSAQFSLKIFQNIALTLYNLQAIII
jgi:hypothetical protein